MLMTVPRRYFFCGSFMFFVCLVFVMSLCASVYMCFVVTCWERADLLALVCGVYCEFITFPLVSWVRCGTWLYRFLIFAPLLTLTGNQQLILKPLLQSVATWFNHFTCEDFSNLIFQTCFYFIFIMYFITYV